MEVERVTQYTKGNQNSNESKLQQYIKPFTVNFNVRWDKETYYKLEAIRAVYSNEIVSPSNTDLLKSLVAIMYNDLSSDSEKKIDLQTAYAIVKMMDGAEK